MNTTPLLMLPAPSSPATHTLTPTSNIPVPLVGFKNRFGNNTYWNNLNWETIIKESYYGELIHGRDVGKSMFVINKDRKDLFDKLHEYLTKDCSLAVTTNGITDGSVPINVRWDYIVRGESFRCSIHIDLSGKIPKVEIIMANSTCRTSYSDRKKDITTLFYRVQAAIDYFHRGMYDGHFDIESI
jgi:hypothetical protein